MTYTQHNKDSQIEISDGVRLGSNVVFGANCKSVRIGFGSFIGNDVYIDCEQLTIGEYTTIHHGSIIHGKNCAIGHNCWFGHYTIIDSLGGETRIGNGVGVGAHSQLWSHMKFGDALAGCRWNSSGKLILEDDVWLVGHSITGPIHAHAQSMLMTGSVAVKDMLPNHVYSGSPAKDMTDKFGKQFEPTNASQRESIFNDYLAEFEAQGKDISALRAVTEFDPDAYSKGITQFNLADRTYMPLYNEIEVEFMRFMLYEKAKFNPLSMNGEPK